MRDYGPIPVIDGQERLHADARYYGFRPNDDAVPTVVADFLAEDVVEIDLPLEGGNLLRHEGLCLVGSTVHTNHAWSAEEAAVRLAPADCDEVIWLDPLEGEPTAHIDIFTAIVDGRAVVTDPEAAEQLSEVIEVVEVDWDHTPVGEAWPSLTNALVLEDVALVPTYKGRSTLAEWEALVPDREVVGVPADSLVEAGGGVHCVTRELPAIEEAMSPPEGCSGCASGGRGAGWPLVLLTLTCTCAGRGRLRSRRSAGPSCGSSGEPAC